MPRLLINGIPVDVADGATVLDATRAAGVAVPTLCHCAELEPRAACMVCVVRDSGSGKTLPACATPAREGMDIVTDDDDIHALRRGTLALLLEEHAGDCEAPCRRACPAELDGARMFHLLAAGRLEDAAEETRNSLLFPGVLGAVCAAPCEGACRRGQYDGPVGIRATHAALAEMLHGHPPRPAAPANRSVAIVGAGLAGLAAAWICARNGWRCVVYERNAHWCTSFRDRVPDTLMEAEFAPLKGWGVSFLFDTEVLFDEAAQPETGDASAPVFKTLCDTHDAVILACSTAPSQQLPHVHHAREERMPVRAVASGKRAAMRVVAGLAGDARAGRRFNSKLGVLRENELNAYAVERVRDDSGLPEDADILQREAARCLQCACLKQDTCALRRHAEDYGVRVGVDRSLPRPPVAPIECFGTILFEPGKCIKCGICVALTRRAGIRPGMTVVGRGLHSRVRGALGATLEEALGAVADACVNACPTAALARKQE